MQNVRTNVTAGVNAATIDASMLHGHCTRFWDVSDMAIEATSYSEVAIVDLPYEPKGTGRGQFVDSRTIKGFGFQQECWRSDRDGRQQLPSGWFRNDGPEVRQE